MKYELENRTKAGMLSHALGVFSKSPDVHAAAKSGQPAMTALRPTIPASVPVPATGSSAGVSDVTIGTANDSTLENKPDARMNPQAGAASATGTTGTTPPAATQPGGGTTPAANATPAQPLPSNHTAPPAKLKKKKKTKLEKKYDVQNQASSDSSKK